MKEDTKKKIDLQKTGMDLFGLAAVFFLIGVLAGNIVFAGLGFLAVGEAVLLRIVNSETAIRPLAIGNGVYFIVYGFLLTTAPLVEGYFQMDGKYANTVFFIGMGGMFFLLGIYNILKKKVCNARVEGTFTGAARQQSKGYVYYAPRFAFTYEGKQYENTNGESYQKKRLLKKYEAGKQYPIYVSTQNPNIFRTRRMIGVGDIALFLLGILFCLLPVGFF